MNAYDRAMLIRYFCLNKALYVKVVPSLSFDGSKWESYEHSEHSVGYISTLSILVSNVYSQNIKDKC